MSDGDERQDLLARLSPHSFSRRYRLFAGLDAGFTEMWTRHVATLFARPQLDMRSRLLVLVGQYTMTERFGPLEETIDAAIREGVERGHVLEIILQCYVYAGQWPVAAATEVFARVVARGPDPQRLDATATPPRDLDRERETWSPTDRVDPRLENLLARYGWKGISTGLRLRPGHHLNLLDTLDALDPEFLQSWLDAVYEEMYSRSRIDDRTRLLCVVGNCLAVGEGHQSRRHMRGALRNGVTPRQLLELVFQTTAIFGHPHLMPLAVDDLVRIVDDMGMLEELVAPGRIGDVRRIVAARVARRAGIEDMETVV